MERMFRKRGLRKYQIYNKLGVSRPTFIRMLKDVNVLNGYQRQTLAKAIGIPVDIIDTIISTNKIDAELSNNIIDLIQRTDDNN